MSRRKIIGTLRIPRLTTTTRIQTVTIRSPKECVRREKLAIYGTGIGEGRRPFLVLKRITRDHRHGACRRKDESRYDEFYEVLFDGKLIEVPCSDVRRHTDEL